MSRRPLLPLVFLLIGVLGSSASYLYFVRTASGRRLDRRLVPSTDFAAANRVLSAYDRHVAVAEMVLLTGVALLGFLRGHPARGLLSATMPPLVTVGVNMTKSVLSRPATGEGPLIHNSFPSGHVALAAATVLAVLLVVPGSVVPAVALPGAAGVSIIASATITAGWHRFSDAAGAVFICMAAAAVVAILTPLGQHPGQEKVSASHGGRTPRRYDHAA